MDVYGGSQEKMIEAKAFLKKNLEKEAEIYFGIKDPDWIDQVTNNWFDDENNYDGRWNVIKERASVKNKVLDLAAGCGTFVLYGLLNGYDVWGVEPEEWKREYFRKKVLASNYPAAFQNHIVCGIGESLPFTSESFDLVTTYQTLEHVRDVKMCIREMLRVLKPGGILYIKSPDYNWSFFEPHYRTFFLPKMNKKLSTAYLKFLGRPLLGLQTLNWITEKEVVKIVATSAYAVDIEQIATYRSAMRQRKIQDLLPETIRNSYIATFLNFIYELGRKINKLRWIGRKENNIDLWVKKVA